MRVKGTQGSTLGKILTPSPSTGKNGTGYHYVHLRRGSVAAGGKHVLLHRLVARVFIGEPYEPGLVVDHIDGNKYNNAAENLRWITQSKNVRKAWSQTRKNDDPF